MLPWLLLLIPLAFGLLYAWLEWRGSSAHCDTELARLDAMRQEILDRHGWDR